MSGQILNGKLLFVLRAKIELRSGGLREIEKLGQTLVTSGSTDSIRHLACTFARDAIAIRARYASERMAFAFKAVDVVQVEKEKADGTRLTSDADSISIANTLAGSLVTYERAVSKCAQTGASLITFALLAANSPQ